MSDLNNPVRFAARNRNVQIADLLKNSDGPAKRVEEIVIKDGQLYVYWEEQDGLLADLRSLANEWADVSEWGDRDEMSRYDRGLKDADADHAHRLKEVVESHE